jgi:hypothetical protein
MLASAHCSPGVEANMMGNLTQQIVWQRQEGAATPHPATCIVIVEVAQALQGAAHDTTIILTHVRQLQHFSPDSSDQLVTHDAAHGCNICSHQMAHMRVLFAGMPTTRKVRMRQMPFADFCRPR